MPKKITLTVSHNQLPSATEYKLIKLIVHYPDPDGSVNGSTVVMLKDEYGRGHQVKLIGTIPATTQEQAILALDNNGVLAGTIGDA